LKLQTLFDQFFLEKIPDHQGEGGQLKGVNLKKGTKRSVIAIQDSFLAPTDLLDTNGKKNGTVFYP